MKHLKTFLSLLIYFTLIPSIELLYPQVQQVWASRYNSPYNDHDNVNGMTVDKFGNVFVTGDAIMGGQGNNYVTIKYNQYGVQQWAAVYDGPGITNHIDYATAIVLDNSGNVYVTGYSESSGLGSGDFATIKYDGNGNQLWVKRYDGPTNGTDGARAMTIDKNGYIYTAGGSVGYDFSGTSDFLTIKYNSNGDSIWVRRYAGSDYSPYWGTSIDFVTSIAVDDSCYVYVTGPSGIQGPPRNKDYITIKYKPNGDSVWVRRYSTVGDDYPVKVLVDNNYNVYVTGFSNDGTGGRDIATVKYNKNGVEQWVRRYNGWQNYDDEPKSASIDKFGNVYVTGYSYEQNNDYDFTTIKYSPGGELLWIEKYNGSGNYQDIAYDIAADDSCNVYVTGAIINSNNNYEFATIKYTTSGVLQWIKNYPGGGHNIAVDSLRNVYVAGTNNMAGTGVDIITIKYSQLVGISNLNNEIPQFFKLYQNYPNPFNPVTKIKFDIPSKVKSEKSNVKITLYDILGREIKTLVNEGLDPGTYVINFDGSNFSSGIFFYTLETENFRETRKMILIR